VADVTLHEEWVAEAIPIPIPGTNRIDYKDVSHPGPANIRFDSIPDADLQARLRTLIEFVSAEIDRKRAIRDAGKRTIAIDLVLADRSIACARVGPPFVSQGSLETTLFPIVLPS
jgi:hypothetical protein